MRLLFVGTSRGARGTEHHLLTMASAMQRRGHDVRLVVDPSGFLQRASALAGLPCSLAVFSNSLDPRGWWALFRQIRVFRPHWVVGASGHEYFPITVIGWLLDCKVALFRHLNTPLGFVDRRILPRLFRLMIAVSRDMHGDLLAQGLPPQQLALVFNPIETRRFAANDACRLALRADLGIQSEDVLVGFAGAMTPDKGAPFFAQLMNTAMRALPKLHMVWISTTRDHDSVGRMIDRAVLPRHHFVSWVDDMQSVYPALDVLAVPSQWREPFGRVSVEAQSCGVFVLASSVGGLPETLRPGEGSCLLPPDAAAAWVSALEAFAASSPEERAWQSAAAVRTAASFDADRVARELEQLFRNN